MRYSISSNSNVDTLLLHHYRILRQVDSRLPEPFRQSSGVPVTFYPTNSYDGDGYRQTTAIQIVEGCIPMVEFEGDQDGLDILADAIYLDTEDDLLALVTRRTAEKPVQATVYWFQDLRESLAMLELRVAKLEEIIENLDEVKR